MKITISIIGIIFITNFCLGQTITRQNGEREDDLPAKVIRANSVRVGKTYIINEPTTSIILYFEIQMLDSTKLTQKPITGEFDYFGNPYAGIPTMTLFSVLYSTDKITYNRYVVDTVDMNSGCCPCHFPVVADSLMFVDETTNNELILFLTHPVRFDCNSVTSYSALFYDNFSTRIKAGIFSIKPFASYLRSYLPINEEEYSRMIRYFAEKKSK